MFPDIVVEAFNNSRIYSYPVESSIPSRCLLIIFPGLMISGILDLDDHDIHFLRYNSLGVYYLPPKSSGNPEFFSRCNVLAFGAYDYP